jgi:Leucine-rich repeat (LRR) protein
MTVSDDEDDNVHDQLPSVEEYKTTLEPGSNKIDPKRIMDSVFASDSEEDDELSLENYDIDMSSDDVPEEDYSDEEEGRDDQLPSVEEIHAQRSGKSKSGECCTWRRFGTFLLLIFCSCAIIIPPILLTTNDDFLERKERIRRFLLDKKVAKQSDLDNPLAPQHKALNFLASEAFRNENLSNEKFMERYALTVFYFGTEGSTWRYDLTFLQPTDVCNWNSYFIYSNNGDLTQEGAICNPDLDPPMVQTLQIRKFVHYSCFFYVVTSHYHLFVLFQTGFHLLLANNNLQGTIPPELQYLSNSLEQMHLEFNTGLSGDFPSSFSNLSNLWSLELQHCALTGELPDWLGLDLPLRRLGLSNNFFTGSIPSSLSTQATSLQILALDDNGLKANIGDFSNLTRLQFLYLEDNKITGELTTPLITNWANMKELDLSNNQIKSSLPMDLFVNMEFLEILDLHGNEFYGQISDRALPQSKLVFLALQNNDLTGTISSSFKLMTNLKHLDLSRNQFSTMIPRDTLSLMTNLRYLFIGSNSYDAQIIPEVLFDLTNLRELSLKQSNLIGQIPAAIGNLTNLQLLDLDQNDLTGKIPEEMGQMLSGLDHLMLNRNQLTGTIPESFASLNDLGM